MVCPYCNENMESGVIHGDRYSIKWIPQEKDKGIFLSPFIKGIKLSDKSSSNSVEAYFCNQCDKVVINLQKDNIL